MVDTGPLKLYLEGRDAFRAGDKEKALNLISESIGTKSPTPYMKSNLEKLAEPNDAVLTLIIHESKGEHHG